MTVMCSKWVVELRVIDSAVSTDLFDSELKLMCFEN